MTPLDDHDASDDALIGLGARLRTDADRRPADLDRLGARIHAERQRARLVLVAGCAAVVLLLAAAIGLRSGGESSLRVGDGADGAPLATEATVPMWTVNPSIPLDPADGEVWAVDVVYDPAMWTFLQFTEDPALRDVQMRAAALNGSGMASYKGEPRVQMYWQGGDAGSVAEAARDALAGRAGIVSVEIGRAEPTSHTRGSGPTVTVAPTTLAPLVRHEPPDPRPTQDEILADGVVTDDEYDGAFWTFVECAEAAGVTFSNFGRLGDGRYQYAMSAARDADACYESLFAQVDRTWQIALDGGPPPSGGAGS